ncbi:MAG: hypothetical protein K5876_02775 [Ruminiclostridium sp.]|nr:hypothetical protein [Ruminiclostridium sp.]
MLSVGRVMEFSAMTNATAPKSSEQLSERKTSTLAADNTDKFVQSGATFTQAYTKATVTDNRSNNTNTSTMPDSDDAVQQAREREERKKEEEARINDEPEAPGQPAEEERPLTAIMRDFVKQTMKGQVEDSRKTDAQRELDEILGTLSDEELDGSYWNAGNTAYRILGFAEELAGGNAAQFGELRAAFEEGFGDSEADFGGRANMPRVSYETYDLVQNGFDYFMKAAGTIQ